MSKSDTVAFEYAKENGKLGIDYNQIYDAVKHGYHQAEKDLALTWKTIRDIEYYLNIVDKDKFNIFSNEYYEEVLKRFNEMKSNQ